MQQVMRWTRAIVALALVAMASPAIVAQESGKLKVTVNYNGRRRRSTRRTRVFVWVFDTPNIGGGLGAHRQRCRHRQRRARSTFSGLPKEVYIAAAFDEKGDYDGTSGPPPTRHADHSSTAIWRVAKAVPTGGADAAVTVTFDATVRMP